MSDVEGYDALAEAEAQAAAKNQRTSWLRRFRWPLMIGVPLLVIAVAVWLVLNGGKSQETDDAYVQVGKAPVAASVSGRVIEVMVHENQRVKKGDPLFRLDERDFAVASEESQAELAQAEGQVLALKASFRQQQARVVQAEASAAFLAKEAQRQKALFEAGVASRDQYDQAVHAAENARLELAAAAQARDIELARLGGRPDLPVMSHPLVLAARAKLARNELTKSYTVVTAPTDGVVTRVDQLQPGAYVNASQAVFWLITGQPWIEANFKEDQLAKMKVGQPADIRIDAYPGQVLHGYVASFSPGTGQAFSVLPAQNTTGNWVKVTQRLPVRIAFDRPPPEMAGRAGLSAKVKVLVAAPGRRLPAGS